MKLNQDGVKSPTRSKPKTHKELVVPDDLADAFRVNEDASANFERFSPGQKREYVDWLAEAKTEATRSRRLGTAVEWRPRGRRATGSI